MKYLFAVIIFLPFIASAQLNSLLWEVSGNGLSDSSYLFGTMHSKDFRVHRFGDSVLAKLNKADLLVVENAEVEDYNLFDLFPAP